MPRIVLPEFHAGQVGAFRLRAADGSRPKRKVIRCGRRWGKTEFGAAIAADGAARGELIGWFAPEHRFVTPAYRSVLNILAPIRASASVMRGLIDTTTGGSVEFWSLDNELAGRSRKYHKVIVDEAAFTKEAMKDIWEQNIEPTLMDFDGDCLVLSNTNGDNYENFMWQICHDPKFRFVEYHAPSWQNPHVPGRRKAETEADYLVRREEYYTDLRMRTHPLVFRQEYEAEFVDFSGVAFFALDKLLVEAPDGVEIKGKRYQPVDYPSGCDSVFFIMDTAVKGGTEHDATAISWWSLSSFGAYPLVCLDWDMQQIDAALLEHMMPQWLGHGVELARQCKARYGFTGGYIEDAQSGSVLLQQCAHRGWPVEAIPSKLTSVGKDARAINASGPVYRGEVKLSRIAYNKNDVTYKDVTRNHFVTQVTAFRIGDKNAARRADDLLDTFTYAVAIGCGGSEGWA